MAHLALGDQFGQRADGLLDGRVRVDAVLVVEVDVVGAEPQERAFDRGLHVAGAAVDDAGAVAGVGDETELRRHDDVVAAALDGLADDFLAVEGAVDLGGVDVGDPDVQGPVDGADRLGVIESPARGVGAAMVMAPRPMRETSSPPSDTCFIRYSLSWRPSGPVGGHDQWDAPPAGGPCFGPSARCQRKRVPR